MLTQTLSSTVRPKVSQWLSPSKSYTNKTATRSMVQANESSQYTTQERPTCYKIEFEVTSPIVQVRVDTKSQSVIIEYSGDQGHYQSEASFPSPISFIEWTLDGSQCTVTAHEHPGCFSANDTARKV